MACRHRGSRGFTLIEMLIVVAIMAILVAIAIPVFSGRLEKSRAAVCSANRRTLMSEYMSLAVIDPGLTLSDYLAQRDLDGCPSGGTYSAGENGYEILCSVHSADAGDGDQTPDPGPEDGTDIYGNITKTGTADFEMYKGYKVGDLVLGSDGIIYECTREDYSYNTDPAGAYSYYCWRVYGTADGSAVSMDSGTTRRYRPGTTVTYNGKYYMYTPKNGGDEASASFNRPSADWTEITSSNEASVAKPSDNTVLFNYFNAYSKGDVVWHNGTLYTCIKDTGSSTGVPASNTACWEKNS